MTASRAEQLHGTVQGETRDAKEPNEDRRAGVGDTVLKMTPTDHGFEWVQPDGDSSPTSTRSARSADDEDDARISATELRQILRSMDEKQTEEELDTLIGEADTDGDGQISHEAFVNLMKAWHKGKEDGELAVRARQPCVSSSLPRTATLPGQGPTGTARSGLERTAEWRSDDREQADDMIGTASIHDALDNAAAGFPLEHALKYFEESDVVRMLSKWPARIAQFCTVADVCRASQASVEQRRRLWSTRRLEL
jgi:calmodulin